MKRRLIRVALAFSIVFTSGGLVWASGSIVFHVEVASGVTISTPEELSFGRVAPGQAVQEDLEVEVWSNVEWQMGVQVTDPMLGGLRGRVEVQDHQGTWKDVTTQTRTILMNQPATGTEGIVAKIPFRFTGSFEDTPGTYSFEVEFTVVPAL